LPTKQQLEDELLQELQDWRRRTADELQRPIYMIASNQLLETIAKRKPKDLEHLSLLSGFGKFKVQKYGPMIVDIVLKYPHPDDPKGIVFDPNDLVDTEEFWKIARSKKKSPSGLKKKSPKQGGPGGLATLTAEEAAEIDIKTVYSWDDLNGEKQIAAQHIIQGNNVFITGSAGTGKSFLLRYVIQELIRKHGEESVAVTGPTGISAVNIGGQTVHSFAGIGLGTGDRVKLIQKVLKNKSCVDRWLKTKVLVIDEISMLDRWLFELLDELARTIRNNQTPFGGLQLIVVGDFMQLPPVRTVTEFENKNFCFQSDVWEAAGLNTGQGTVYLEKVVRQDDEEFVKYLNEVRVGILSPAFQRQLQMCMPPFKPKPNNGIIPTKLYATNKQVDNENFQHLLALPGQTVTMVAQDKWKTLPAKSSMVAMFKDGVEKLIPEKIDLKIGAQVMLLRNRSRMTYGGTIKATGPSLVNGSRGRIVDFTESVARPGLMIPTVQFDNGMVTTIGPVEYVYKSPGGEGELVRFQVPLKLAW
jgi:ATP-dependent DNA helicase PIF1